MHTEPKPTAFDLDNWVTQVRKGLLELCIVAVLAEGEMYAYDLVKRLANIKALVITEGTIYPLLSRLRSAGLITSRLEESSNGPARKYYVLTDEGRRTVHAMRTYWCGLANDIGSLLEKEGKP
ncbi:MAG: PadR family transcriptional regulator [Candidatus Hydrogenedentes bacterium]|nr:PadR family transcriptional regulator [Candidatus Hydrogenedentota bacterium]